MCPCPAPPPCDPRRRADPGIARASCRHRTASKRHTLQKKRGLIFFIFILMTPCNRNRIRQCKFLNTKCRFYIVTKIYSSFYSLNKLSTSFLSSNFILYMHCLYLLNPNVRMNLTERNIEFKVEQDESNDVTHHVRQDNDKWTCESKTKQSSLLQ